MACLQLSANPTQPGEAVRLAVELDIDQQFSGIEWSCDQGTIAPLGVGVGAVAVWNAPPAAMMAGIPETIEFLNCCVTAHVSLVSDPLNRLSVGSVVSVINPYYKRPKR